jgi:hypothetical protein
LGTNVIAFGVDAAPNVIAAAVAAQNAAASAGIAAAAGC